MNARNAIKSRTAAKARAASTKAAPTAAAKATAKAAAAKATTKAEAAEWELMRCISRALDGIRAGDAGATDRYARAANAAAKDYAAAKAPTAEDLHRLADSATAASGHAQRQGLDFSGAALFLRSAAGILIFEASRRH